MKKYIAIVRFKNSKIETMQDFSDEQPAIDHVAKFGGVVANNPGGNYRYWLYNSDTNVITVDVESEAVQTLSDIRDKRDSALRESDWHGNSDVTMSSAMTAYRAALRDYPATFAANNEAAFPELGE